MACSGSCSLSFWRRGGFAFLSSTFGSGFLISTHQCSAFVSQSILLFARGVAHIGCRGIFGFEGLYITLA
jgi:hypothetical protein